jgi:hypothetical protein
MQPYGWFFIWIGGLILILLVISPGLLDSFLYRLSHVVESLLAAGLTLGILLIVFQMILRGSRK